MAGPSMLVWLHQQHFQSGPTIDLAQINHAISSNADEQAFKSFCLRGGHEAGPWTRTAAKDVQGMHMTTITSWDTMAQQIERYPTCLLTGDSMAIDWMMLITTDLCRQVMQHPTRTRWELRAHTMGDTALDKRRDARSWRPIQTTSDKGPWLKWLHELAMQDVHRVLDYQPTMHADKMAQRKCRPNEQPQRFTIHKIPNPSVANASPGMHVDTIDGTQPVSDIYRNC
eukprot:496997-Amphidinium_carterae.1